MDAQAHKEEATVLTGSCLCGACVLTAVPQAEHAGVCHCGQCNKWSGGMFIGLYCGETIQFKEGSPVKSYRGSAWGERLFCGECGSTLVWQTQDGQHQTASVHLFDDPSAFPLTDEIFIDRKPSSYRLAGNLSQMTEAEVFAKYPPKADS